MALQTYYPEMNEAKPVAKIEASIGHYGKHYFLKTPLELKGRGVKLVEVLKASQLTPQAQSKAGWFIYKVTELAFEKIKKDHPVSMEILL